MPRCRPYGAEPLGGDLIKGARNASAIGILVERTTRLVILARMEWADAESARQGFTRKLRHVPTLLRKPITYDRGKERAEHECQAERLAIQVFFAALQPMATRHQ